MIRKTIKKKKVKTRIEKKYNVYGDNGNLINSFNNLQDLLKFYNIKNSSTMYANIKKNSYFLPNKDALKKIKVEIERKEIKEEINLIKPFILKEFEIQNIVNLPGEEWKQIKGFGGYYYCSNKGRFKCVDIQGNEKLLNLIYSQNRTKRWYTDVNLNPVNDDGSFEKSIAFRTSRILAQTWLDPTLKLDWKEDKRDVDHIDNNSRNECIENLRVCTHAENIKYAMYEQGKVVGKGPRECCSINIYTDHIIKYSSTKILIENLFQKDNYGYFNKYYNSNSLVNGKYLVGYDEEELKERAKKKRFQRGIKEPS